ncbi:MAG: hypothetical protein ACQESC_04045 [Nanobdellota archaeon]
MAKTKTWYEKLHYKHNPFTIKPGYFDDEVIGYDKEIDTIIAKINDGNIVFLQGEYGQGKTTILTYIINEFSGKNKIAKITRSRSDRPYNYEKLLVRANKGIKKAFGMKAKNAILIVDEAGKLNKHDYTKIEHLHEQGNLKSIVLIDNEINKKLTTSSIEKEISKNTIAITPLSEEDAISLVRSRLGGGEKLISDQLIKEIFEISKKNTRQFLENLEDVFRKAIDSGKEKISKKDLDILN